MAPSIDSTSLYGTLNLLILQALAREPLHGLAIARRIRESTDESLRIEEGALDLAVSLEGGAQHLMALHHELDCAL